MEEAKRAREAGETSASEGCAGGPCGRGGASGGEGQRQLDEMRKEMEAARRVRGAGGGDERGGTDDEQVPC